MRGVVTIYMDDILIFGSQTKEQHHGILVWVINICKHCLYLKVEKCTVEQPMVEYLSLILLEGHIETQSRSLASETGQCLAM